MARITLRLPDELHSELVARARRSHRSLNQAIVDILRKASYQKQEPAGEALKEIERRRLKAALGDRVMEIKPEDFGPFRTGEWGALDKDALFAAMPRLDPPLSHTIVQEREESHY
jgi:plasmid stability protein